MPWRRTWATAPKKKFSITTVFDAISGCIAPLIPVLIGAGFIKIILLLAEQFGLLAAGDPTHTVLTFVGDAGFYFLPVFIGATAPVNSVRTWAWV